MQGEQVEKQVNFLLSRNLTRKGSLTRKTWAAARGIGRWKGSKEIVSFQKKSLNIFTDCMQRASRKENNWWCVGEMIRHRRQCQKWEEKDQEYRWRGWLWTKKGTLYPHEWWRGETYGKREVCKVELFMDDHFLDKVEGGSSAECENYGLEGLSEFLGGKGSRGSLRIITRVVERSQGPNWGWRSVIPSDASGLSGWVIFSSTWGTCSATQRIYYSTWQYYL